MGEAILIAHAAIAVIGEILRMGQDIRVNRAGKISIDFLGDLITIQYII